MINQSGNQSVIIHLSFASQRQKRFLPGAGEDELPPKEGITERLMDLFLPPFCARCPVNPTLTELNRSFH